MVVLDLWKKKAQARNSTGNSVEDKEVTPLQTPATQEYIQARLRELELENLSLKKRLWQTRYIGTLPTSLILLGIGAACLLFSYLWSSSILTFIGLGLALWGILIMYLSPSRHVRAELLDAVSSSMQKSIDALVSNMGYTGKAVFFHPKSLTGLGQGYVFIPHYTTSAITGNGENSNLKLEDLNLLPYSSESTVPQIYLHPKGMFLAAPSQGMVDLIEKEIGINFALVSFDRVQEVLPKLLIEELNLVDDMSVEEEIGTGNIVARATGGPCTDICKLLGQETRLRNHLGCPLCSVVALVISKVKGKPVIVKETNATDNTITTTFVVMNQ
jgi:hypothetical protein